jgi:hypothetical protein
MRAILRAWSYQGKHPEDLIIISCESQLALRRLKERLPRTLHVHLTLHEELLRKVLDGHQMADPEVVPMLVGRYVLLTQKTESPGGRKDTEAFKTTKIGSGTGASTTPVTSEAK